MLSICLLYVSLRSRVSPSILWLRFMGSVVLFICNASCVLYSAGVGVKRVECMLFRFCLEWDCLFESMFAFPVGMIECLHFLCLCRCVLML